MNGYITLIVSGLLALSLAAYSGAGKAQTVDTMPKPMPRIDAPMPLGGGAQADMPDANAVDSETTTGAVMNEKDMLQYCVNISDGAREARYVLIKKKLEKTQAEIDEKLVALDKKLKDIKAYVEVRDKFQSPSNWPSSTFAWRRRSS